MNAINISLKNVCLSVGALIVADLIGCLVFAVGIYYSLLPSDSLAVLSVLSLLLASIVGGALSMKRSGNHGTGYAAGGVCFIILAVFGFVAHGPQCEIGLVIRSAVALFTGVFIGNFLGEFNHNRLRKSRKIKRIYTK